MGRTTGGTLVVWFCLVSGAALSQEKIDGSRLQADSYFRCNNLAARKVATQEGDPVSLALAVRGMCSQEDAALLKAFLRQHPPQLARKLMDSVRAGVIESNAATIVRVRMGPGPLEKRQLVALEDCQHRTDYDRAIRGCTLFLEILPPNTKSDIVFMLRGKAYVSKEQHDEAVADFTRAIQLQPGRATYHEYRGKSYVLMGLPQRAFFDFDLALAIDPLADTTYYNRAFAYSIVGQNDRAIQDLNQAIRLKPDEPINYILRGDIYGDMREVERARSDYAQALALPARTAAVREEQEALRARLAGPESNREGQPATSPHKSAALALPFSHGVVRRAPATEAIAPFSVKTSPGARYFVKLVRESDKREQFAGFIVGGQPSRRKYPRASTSLRYAVGQDWIDEQEFFGSKTAFYKADRLLTFSIGDGRVLGSEVELILQHGGNLRTSTIGKDKF